MVGINFRIFVAEQRRIHIADPLDEGYDVVIGVVIVVD